MTSPFGVRASFPRTRAAKEQGQLFFSDPLGVPPPEHRGVQRPADDLADNRREATPNTAAPDQTAAGPIAAARPSGGGQHLATARQWPAWTRASTDQIGKDRRRLGANNRFAMA